MPEKTDDPFLVYRSMIHPDRQLYALRLLHDQIQEMIRNLEERCAQDRIDINGCDLSQMLDALTHAQDNFSSRTIIEEVLETDWLSVRLSGSRMNSTEQINIRVSPQREEHDPARTQSIGQVQWAVYADNYLYDDILAEAAVLALALEEIKQDGRVDAPLRIFPVDAGMRALAQNMFHRLEVSSGMHELDRVSMLVLLMNSNTIYHDDFAQLANETNAQLYARIKDIYEIVEPDKKQDKISRLYAFQEGKRPGFLQGMVTDLPGIEKTYAQDVDANEEFNVRFSEDIVLGGDIVQIRNAKGGAAWDGLIGRPLVDVIDTPFTHALGASIIGVRQDARFTNLIIDQRMKEQPINWQGKDQS